MRSGLETASTILIESSGNTIEDDARAVLSFKLVEGILREYQSRHNKGKIRCKPVVVISLNLNHNF